jgi:formylglycine-generating enzyme required for sulfatase activity/tRNA A-37 threonylcarbamoyl transferase component Bud32
MHASAELFAYGLRQVIDVSPEVLENLAEMAGQVAESAGTAGKIIALLRKRLTDHGETLPRALAGANDRAWQAVAVALAGRGFLTRVKEFFTGTTPKVIHEQVEGFLARNADSFPGTSDEFRRSCLAELHQARKCGLLSADRLDPDATARQAAAYQGLADPQGLVAGARQAAAAVADALPADYPNLARLLKGATPPGQAPLLVSAFCFFFRREVEGRPELARGLIFDGLRQLSASQESAFAQVGDALATLNAHLRGQGRRFEDVLDQLGQIEAVVTGIDAKVDALTEQIADLARRNHVPSGPPRPQYAVTINNEREQALARRLLEEVRKLPPERQRADDLSLLGDVLRAAGLFPEARESYAGAAGRTEDRAARAAVHYKAYLAALEQRQWDEGLAALTEAATLDEAHYAPFPLHQFQPRRILGAGGFGTAFLCHDQYMGCDVVIKSLHHAELERGLDMVFAEARTLLLLSREHPAIIGVQHCSYADAARARPYIVMDYFPAVSLQAHLEQLGPKAVLPLEDFLPVARQLAEAVKAAHARGVLHRDLKPDNVLVRKDNGRWQVKVIDFGLAVRTRVVQVSTSRPVRERTVYGDSAAGTARYAPPEQMGEMPGVPVGTYSDVYAFGKLCCFALFRDTEPKSRHWESIPSALYRMLEQCIEKDLEHRLRDFGAVLPVLEALDPTEVKRRQQDEAHRQAEERQRRDRKEAEERQRRDRKEAERRRQEQELARLRQEGETRLARLLREALERTRGNPTKDDSQAAKELCRRYQITSERGQAIYRDVRQQWQKEQPREPQPGEVITNSLGMKFAWVPPGSFLMGSPPGEESRLDDETQHRVTLSKGFYLGVYPVTQAQWQAVMGSNPSRFQGDDRPVENISWEDCQEFCKKLAARDGKRYRLPTEAEWEYACRAGTTTPFSFGQTISTDQANYDGNYTYGQAKKGVYREQTTPVGSFPANTWGLYDMHGNVWEWCQDWYGPYPTGEEKDPKGYEKGEARVLRGGSWIRNPRGCRSASRRRSAPSGRGGDYGCRVALCLD